MVSRPSIVVALLAGASSFAGCQEYPFEWRAARRSEVRKISEVVYTSRPADILFVVDNSSTMEEERNAIRQNAEIFLGDLLDSAANFQLGIITTDVECNVPGPRNCTAGTAGAASVSCCNFRPPTMVCQDEDTNGDGDLSDALDRTNCDAGRLRSATGQNRIFRPPPPSERAAWIDAFGDTLGSFACDVVNSPQKPQGSAFEAGLEAALLAVGCSVGAATCPESQPGRRPVAELNSGFIREDADLVLVFITDEDDCSFDHEDYPDVYRRPATGEVSTELYQGRHLCQPDECYAYYGAHIDLNGNGLGDWADAASAKGYFQCSTDSVSAQRLWYPPAPSEVSHFLDAIVAFKGGDVRRVRAAGIVAGVADPSAERGFRAAGCFRAAGPSDNCSCLNAASSELFCDLTIELGQGGLPRRPAAVGDITLCSRVQPDLGGCTSMPGGRYVSFLRELAARRTQAGVSPDVLIDSICQARYDDTLFRIVNNIILKSCFDLGLVPRQVGDVSVSLNGRELPNVAPRSRTEGWSWVPGASEVCLEGGLRKTINDRFEIYVLPPPP